MGAAGRQRAVDDLRLAASSPTELEALYDELLAREPPPRSARRRLRDGQARHLGRLRGGRARARRARPPAGPAQPFATAAAARRRRLISYGTFAPSAPIFGRRRDRRAEPRRSCADVRRRAGPAAHPSRSAELLARARAPRDVLRPRPRGARAPRASRPRCVADGHELACHGDDHRLLAFASPRERPRADRSRPRTPCSRRPARLPRRSSGRRTAFAAPGWRDVAAAARLPRLCLGRSGLRHGLPGRRDDRRARVGRCSRPGAVILLHDGDGSGRGASREQTVEALPAFSTPPKPAD